jgi:hypothetical protein
LGIFKRMPDWGQVAQVYGVIVLMVYGWTILSFLWKLPSWRIFLTVNEIFDVLAYSVVINLLESLAVLCLPVLMSLALPKKWFCDSFTVRGSSLAILGLGYMMYFAWHFNIKGDYPGLLLRATPWIFCAILLLMFVVDRIIPLRRAIEGFADRATIFIYISIPLSLLSLLVFVFRLVV